MKRFIYGLCLYGRGESFGNRGFPDLLPLGIRFSRIYYIGKRGNNNSNDNNNNNDNSSIWVSTSYEPATKLN